MILVRSATLYREYMRSTTTLVAVLALALSTTGCKKIKEKLAEKAAEKVIETATGAEEVDLNGSSGGVTVKDAKGGVVKVGTTAKLPEDWPASVPIYPSSTVVASMSANDAKIVHLQTKASVEDVATFYKQKMGGFTKEAELDLGDSKTLGYKKEKESVGIVIAANKSERERGTVIQINYTVRK